MAKKQKLNELALGYAGAAVSAACMVLLGIFWNVGWYVGAAEAMAKWHLYFSSSVGGIIGGAVEAAVWVFVGLYALAWCYNKWA